MGQWSRTRKCSAVIPDGPAAAPRRDVRRFLHPSEDKSNSTCGRWWINSWASAPDRTMQPMSPTCRVPILPLPMLADWNSTLPSAPTEEHGQLASPLWLQGVVPCWLKLAHLPLQLAHLLSTMASNHHPRTAPDVPPTVSLESIRHE